VTRLAVEYRTPFERLTVDDLFDRDDRFGGRIVSVSCCRGGARGVLESEREV
jgi:hypothetical protein